MRGYYPRVSLKILPDSGDEPPPVLSRGQRDPDVNRNDKDGTWLAEAASVLWSMRPPMLGSTGPRVQHTTWLREQMWEFLRSSQSRLSVNPIRNEFPHLYSINPPVTRNLFLLCSCPLPRRVISSSLPRKPSPLPASPAPPTPKAVRSRQSVSRSANTRSHPVHRATTRPGCCIA